MSVFPAASRQFLPVTWQRLMIDPVRMDMRMRYCRDDLRAFYFIIVIYISVCWLLINYSYVIGSVFVWLYFARNLRSLTFILQTFEWISTERSTRGKVGGGCV